MEFRPHFGYDTEAASDAATIPADRQGVSLTVQSQAEDADINIMISRFLHTGVMPQAVVLPQYGDFDGVSDYQSALHAVMHAQEAFLALPAKVRARFDNDPQALLEFVSDPRNKDEGRQLGLFKEIGDGIDRVVDKVAPAAAAATA